MSFNNYIWELYKKTDGNKVVEQFKNREDYKDDIALFKIYNAYYLNMFGEDKLHDLIEDIWCYNISEFVEDDLQTSNLEILYKNIISDWEYKDCLLYIPCISMGLSIIRSDFFIPYMFYCRFFELTKIADYFSIELPKTPAKNDYEGRCMYYYKLCEAFYKFRRNKGMTSHELCAFLYGFSPNVINKDAGSINKASQAWLIGGGFIETEKEKNFLFWQTSEETKKGDLMLFYEKNPVSSVSSIWTAKTDGVVDPLFYYYSYAYIGDKINIPNIHLGELKNNTYFKNHPLIKKNMQGVNGYLLSWQDYRELVKIMESKKFFKMPIVESCLIINSDNIQIERDVEIHLLEPLLNSFGLKEGVDYKRQIGIHAGRGHRIFPDYVVHYSDKENDEYAKILIEAKYHIKNNKEREEAFLQARSYALLLQSYVIVLCDKYYIWIYQSKECFDRNNYERFQWNELSDADKYNDIKKVFV